MWLQKLIRRLFCREVIAYIIVGVLTTLVNLGVFALLSAWVGHERWWVSNFPAILAAVIFAFIANKMIVFRSDGPILQEIGKFLLSRLATALAFEYGAMFILTDLMQMRSVLTLFGIEILTSKLLTQILVMIGNYVLSKYFIFTKSKHPEADHQ